MEFGTVCPKAICNTNPGSFLSPRLHECIMTNMNKIPVLGWAKSLMR